MSKCNSQAQLHLEMARVYDFCAGTVFEGKEWECTKYLGGMPMVASFQGSTPSDWEFALNIVEDRLVWADDIMYAHGTPVRVVQAFGEGFILADGTRIAKECLSFSPPAPPKPMKCNLLEAAEAVHRSCQERWGDSNGATISANQLVEHFKSLRHHPRLR